jgi:hypothetical protein
MDTLADSTISKNGDSGPGRKRNDYADTEAAAMTVRIPELPGIFLITFDPEYLPRVGSDRKKG